VQGDHVCALVMGVEKDTWAGDKRAPVILSTAIAGILPAILAKEVPEVGTTQCNPPRHPTHV
jgi:transcription antitermination factor NusA-like protein